MGKYAHLADSRTLVIIGADVLDDKDALTKALGVPALSIAPEWCDWIVAPATNQPDSQKKRKLNAAFRRQLAEWESTTQRGTVVLINQSPTFLDAYEQLAHCSVGASMAR